MKIGTKMVHSAFAGRRCTYKVTALLKLCTTSYVQAHLARIKSIRQNKVFLT